MFRLDGKVAIVTGAGGEIGSAIASDYAKQGAKLALVSYNANKLEKLANKLKSDGYEEVKIYPTDLKNKQDILDTVEKIKTDYGSVDILVNCAGITRDNLIIKMNDDDWDMVLDTNLRSVYILSKAVLRIMMKKRYGRIINISSVVGFTGNVGQVNYSASKGGLVSFSKSLAQEVASRNITVNVVAPGYIDTTMTSGLKDDVKDTLVSRIPMKRMGVSSEVSKACVFLASGEASYVTGQSIHVNGGMFM